MTTDELMALLDKATAGPLLVEHCMEGGEFVYAVISSAPNEADTLASMIEREDDAIALAAAVNYLRSDEFRRVREDAARWGWVMKNCLVQLAVANPLGISSSSYCFTMYGPLHGEKLARYVDTAIDAARADDHSYSTKGAAPVTTAVTPTDTGFVITVKDTAREGEG